MFAPLAIIGEYNRENATHTATNAAIEHSCTTLGVHVPFEWIPTSEIDDPSLRQRCGLWIAPGSPYKDMLRTLEAIRFAREQEIPCLGTCGGFQHMIIEYVRNALGFRDAQHAEYDRYASELFITRLNCSLVGLEMELTFQQDSMVRRIYRSTHASEKYYCNFGVSPDRIDVITSGDLRIVGADELGEARVVELPRHPFFIGTLFVPQANSSPGSPHPLITKFVDEVSSRQHH